MKVKIVIICITLCLFLGGCALNERYEDDIENYAGNLYFPENIGFGQYTNKWFSHELNSLNEPILFTQTNEGKTIYRFTCLRSFNYPFSIRVEINKDNESAELFFTMGNDIMSNEYKTLDNTQVESVIEAIEENDYWNMPFEGGGMGLDGSQWIIEGLMNDGYQAISRWSPTNTTSYSYYVDGSIAFQHNPDDSEIGIYNLGHFFIQLSEQNIEDLY